MSWIKKIKNHWNNCLKPNGLEYDGNRCRRRCSVNHMIETARKGMARKVIKSNAVGMVVTRE